jgi:hypothetical protein
VVDDVQDRIDNDHLSWLVLHLRRQPDRPQHAIVARALVNVVLALPLPR